MSDLYKVVTPENIELEYEIAGIGSRFLALVIDTFIQSALVTGAYFGLTLFGIQPNLEEKFSEISSSIAGAILIIVAAIIWLGYFVILETLFNGQSIGKKLINIRVRKEQGLTPHFWDFLLRNLVRLVDFMPFFYGVGFIVMFSNPKAKRLGDYAAGTIVVKEMSRKQVRSFLDNQTAVTMSINEEPSGLHALYPWLKTIGLMVTEQDYQLLKNLQKRRYDLDNFNFLTYGLINRLMIKAEIHEMTPIEPGDFPIILEEIIRLYEQARMI